MAYLQCEKCLMESSVCTCEVDERVPVESSIETNPEILQSQLIKERQKIVNLSFLVQKLSIHNVKLQAQLSAQAKELAMARDLIKRSRKCLVDFMEGNIVNDIDLMDDIQDLLSKIDTYDEIKEELEDG